ncbi:MAG: hypothetical protein U5K37_06790 [Natrialbaceae archaeon]|nr:hypothetical protein [Natrialbaceae archaeon]
MSVGLSRGQTNMDFAIGIGIFVIATAFVFSFVPTIVTPFDTGIGGAENAQADRIAGLILTEYGEDNYINTTWFDFNITGESADDLIVRLGLRQGDGSVAFDHVNITVTPLHETVATGAYTREAGDVHAEGRPTASSGRIVTFDTSGVCNPGTACRLVVKVW